MQCKNCGRFFKPTGHGRKPQYCSDKCRVNANRKRRKQQKQSNTDSQADRQSVMINLPSKTVKTTVGNEDLSKRTFDRMLDSTLEEELRFTRDVLHKALISPDTPASALAAISRELVNVTEKLEATVNDSEPSGSLFGGEAFDGSTVFDSSLI